MSYPPDHPLSELATLVAAHGPQKILLNGFHNGLPVAVRPATPELHVVQYWATHELAESQKTRLRIVRVTDPTIGGPIDWYGSILVQEVDKAGETLPMTAWLPGRHLSAVLRMEA